MIKNQPVRRRLHPPRPLPARVRPHEAGDAQGARQAEAPDEDAAPAPRRLPRVLEHRGCLVGLPQLPGARRPRRPGKAAVGGRRRRPPGPAQRPPQRRHRRLRRPPPFCRPLTRRPSARAPCAALSRPMEAMPALKRPWRPAGNPTIIRVGKGLQNRLLQAPPYTNVTTKPCPQAPCPAVP
uniref:Uncharacterized protein n=1 Tax=Cairina moschata TaxID=8855 RepID=A0A8C3BS22_CAIMO